MSSAAMTMMNASPAFRRFVPEDDPFPQIRSALAPEYAELPAEDLAALLAQSGIRAEAMEGFFDDVGNFFKKAAPVVAQVAGKALPGIISGATTGAALGPWGALGGAVLGGVTSALSGGKPAAPAGRGGGPLASVAGAALPALAGLAGGAGGPLGALAGAAAPALAGLVGGQGGNPAGVLLGLLGRPELQQALKSMALGPMGAKTVPAGAAGTPVPVSGFANLLGTLASKAF